MFDSQTGYGRKDMQKSMATLSNKTFHRSQERLRYVGWKSEIVDTKSTCEWRC